MLLERCLGRKMKKGYGRCPSTCGELVQGYINKNEYISSYCIDMYSRASISLISPKNFHQKNNLEGKNKSLCAIKNILDYLDVDGIEIENIDLRIKSRIPTGKGMASSTADIGASVMALLDYLDMSMDVNDISKIVSKVEPTDSIYHENICIFDPIRGKKKEDIGILPFEKVLVLEPYSRINTIKLRKRNRYYNLLKQNAPYTKAAFQMLKEGIEKKEIKKIRDALFNSALANESIKKTPFLREIGQIVEKYEVAANISHTGTVIGILMDRRVDEEKLAREIKDSSISRVYKKQYMKKIICGGLKKGY